VSGCIHSFDNIELLSCASSVLDAGDVMMNSNEQNKTKPKNPPSKNMGSVLTMING
jgi:hypothetical protein